MEREKEWRRVGERVEKRGREHGEERERAVRREGESVEKRGR